MPGDDKMTDCDPSRLSDESDFLEDLPAVREYLDGRESFRGSVQLIRAESGRLAIRTWCSCEHTATEIDLLDLIDWFNTSRYARERFIHE